MITQVHMFEMTDGKPVNKLKFIFLKQFKFHYVLMIDSSALCTVHGISGNGHGSS